jgi:hypothetical protein
VNPVAQPPVISPVASPSVRRPWGIWGILAVLAAGGLILFLFDPTQHSFYPVCPLYKTTGLLCPGCGTLRAVHQLTHGNFAAAWRFNPMFVSLLPVAGWLAFREIVKQLTGRILPGIFTHPVFIWLIVGSLVVFGILRNL